MTKTTPQHVYTQLRVRRSAWERVVRVLQTTTARLAVGSIRRHGEHGELLLLVDALEIPNEIPNGHQRPPLDDWCVVILDHSAESSREAILRELRPRHGQLLVVVELDSDDASKCRIWATEKSETLSIDSCNIVGSGMLQLEQSPQPREFNPLRASRTCGALRDDLYLRLRDSTVTVVGLGRNGSQLCFMLAGLGVGRLRLLDADTVGLENLDGMPGLTMDDVGCSKSEALAARLYAFQPEMSISYMDQDSNNRDAALMLHRPCDLFVTTVDSDTPRLGVSLLANRTLTPHLDIGTAIQPTDDARRIQMADVRLLLPGMCVSCVGGLANAESTLYELAAPQGSLKRGQPQDWSDQRAGSLVHWNSIACGLGTEAWLSLLRGDHGAIWHSLTRHANGQLEHQSAQLAEVDGCPYCGMES